MNQGLHTVSAARYHADDLASEPSLSNSIESPLKAWHSHPRLNPNYRAEEDGKFDVGTAAHALLLEGVNKMHVCHFDDWRKKVAQEQRDEARQMQKLPILARHADAVLEMIGVATTFIGKSEIAEYWQEADSELTGLWQEDDIWLRCRFDRLAKNMNCIIDYKSTTDASPETFSRQIVRMGYHWQDAFYRRGARALGSRHPKFIFLAQSVEAPYECTLHGCDPALQEIADAEVEDAIQIWRDCIGSGKWPSYGGRIHWATPATWQIKQHEERILEAA